MSGHEALSLTLRIRVVAAVIASFFAVLSPLLLFGREGIWWIQMLVVGSAPLLAIAVLTAFVFAASIRRKPFTWAVSAGVIAIVSSVVTLWLLTGTLIGAVATPVAILAPLAFLFFSKLFDAAAPAEAHPPN